MSGVPGIGYLASAGGREVPDLANLSEKKRLANLCSTVHRVVVGGE